MASRLAAAVKVGIQTSRQKIFSYGVRSLQTSCAKYGAHDAEFAAAKERLNTLTEDPGNQVKLQIYGLFKQATVGKCNTPKPGMMDFVGKAKWEAWNSLGDISQDEAQKKYIDLVNELAGKDPSAEAAGSASAPSTSEDILVEMQGKMQVIKLNRPNKKNALKVEMYNEIASILEHSGKDKNITLSVFTGAGDYYCSGNDLSNFMNIDPADIAQMAKDAGEVLRRYVASYIDYPKPLCAVINGPAVGVSVTVLGLFDGVYATDKATFHTPFSALGQSPEGCSSLVFPKIMGHAKANEMLLFNKKLTAKEAMDCNLVSEVYPDHSFQSEVWEKLRKMALLPPNSMRLSKTLICDAEREALHAANNREVELLVQRWQSEECINAIMSFFSQK